MTIELDPETIPDFLYHRFVFRLIRDSVNKTKAVYGEKCVKPYEQRALNHASERMVECVHRYAKARGESILKYEALLR
jgi:hypothetical protein